MIVELMAMKDVGGEGLLYRLLEELVKHNPHQHEAAFSHLPSSSKNRVYRCSVASVGTNPPLFGFKLTVSNSWTLPSTDRQCIAQVEVIGKVAAQPCTADSDYRSR